MTKRVLLGVAVVIAVAAIVVALARSGGVQPETAESQRLLPVEATPVEFIEAYEVERRFAGRVTARRSSDLGFERGGMLASVMVDEGAQVGEGDKLAQLDVRSLEAQLEQARASEAEAKARLSLADVTVNRQRQLLEKRNVSQQRFDEARFERQAIAAQMAAAQANVRSLSVALELATIRAPYAGSIVARMADEGTVVSPGQPIFRLLETGVMEARIGIPPDVVGTLERGTTYQVEIGKELYPARLTEILNEVDVETRTVTAVFAADAPPTSVRSGELARLQITERITEQGFWVPIEALSEGRRGLWSVYAVVPEPPKDDEEGDTATRAKDVAVLERRTVQLLHTETDRAFVRGTLSAGDLIVTAGAHRLVPGQHVRVTTPAMN